MCTPIELLLNDSYFVSKVKTTVQILSGSLLFSLNNVCLKRIFKWSQHTSSHIYEWLSALVKYYKPSTPLEHLRGGKPKAHFWVLEQIYF